MKRVESARLGRIPPFGGLAGYLSRQAMLATALLFALALAVSSLAVGPGFAIGLPGTAGSPASAMSVGYTPVSDH